MKILNEIVKGAATQFGREFGRAGANSILKGANSYTIKDETDYQGRIKPSDSKIVKAIKEINKIKFATTNKANVSRLIELTDIVLSTTSFEGNDTLNQLTEFQDLLEFYNKKFEHGNALVGDTYEDKSVEYLDKKRNDLVESMKIMNNETKAFIAKNIELARDKKKSKKTSTILAIPFIGTFGFHKFYLGNIGMGVLYFIFCWTTIPFLVSIVEFFEFINMSNEKFDDKYNPEYAYYNQFSVGS